MIATRSTSATLPETSPVIKPDYYISVTQDTDGNWLHRFHGRTSYDPPSRFDTFDGALDYAFQTQRIHGGPARIKVWLDHFGWLNYRPAGSESLRLLALSRRTTGTSPFPAKSLAFEEATRLLGESSSVLDRLTLAGWLMEGLD